VESFGETKRRKNESLACHMIDSKGCKRASSYDASMRLAACTKRIIGACCSTGASAFSLGRPECEPTPSLEGG